MPERNRRRDTTSAKGMMTKLAKAIEMARSSADRNNLWCASGRIFVAILFCVSAAAMALISCRPLRGIPSVTLVRDRTSEPERSSLVFWGRVRRLISARLLLFQPYRAGPGVLAFALQ